MMTSLLEMTSNIANPIASWYLFQPHQVAKLIERHTAIQEDAAHHVLFAAKQAIRGHVMMLPHGTKFGLYASAIVHFANLLELIDADNDVLVFLHGNLLHHVQDLLGSMCFGGDAKRHTKF